VREIVEEAGVTKPTLYYHFDSKEGLYSTLMEHALEEWRAVLDDPLEAEASPLERILELCSRVFLLFQERLPVVRLAYAMYYGPPQGAPEFDFDAYYFRFLDRLTALIRDAQAAGALRKDRQADEIAMAVLALADAAMEMALNHPDFGLTTKYLQRQLELLLDGIATPAKKTARPAPRKKGRSQ